MSSQGEKEIKIYIPPNVLQGIFRQQQPTLLALNWCDNATYEVIKIGELGIYKLLVMLSTKF